MAVVPDGYELVFEDTFDAPRLDPAKWLDRYLPQWTSGGRSVARYDLADGQLHLRIDPDQEPWCPEFDGHTRVSSLQTGLFSGPVGSSVGQHRFHDGLTVREAQTPRRLYTPTYGAFELRARTELHPDSMVALWLIGYEDAPERSGEICVCEIFGSDVTEDRAWIGMGVHPFGDPHLVDDFAQVEVAIDVREFHEYAAVWTPDGVTFHVDGALVRTVAQSPDYPMQVMLGIYDFAPPSRIGQAGPARFVVDWFRGYQAPA